MKCIKVLIATAEKEIYRGKASMVIAPSVNGEVAIMPGHAPLLVLLKPGEIRIDCSLSSEDPCNECHVDYMIVLGGYLEVQSDSLTILADAVERETDIDEAQAQQAIKQAKQMLKSPNKEKVSRALLDLELAIAQLSLIRRNSKQSFLKPK